VVARLDEVETLLIVVPRVREEPGFFLERDAPNYLRRPSDRASAGPQAVEERPADRTGLDAVAALEHLGQRRLARADRPDQRPGFALAECPAQVAEDDLAAGPDDGRVIEEYQPISAGVRWESVHQSQLSPLSPYRLLALVQRRTGGPDRRL